MSQYIRSIPFVEAKQFDFLKTLLGDLNLGELPRMKETEEAFGIRSTQNSPDEVRLEYGSKNSWGEYPCHAVLTLQGLLKERNCIGILEDGRHTLEHGAKRKEARRFFSTYPMPSKPKPTVELEPIRIAGQDSLPQNAATLIIERAQITFGITPLEGK